MPAISHNRGIRGLPLTRGRIVYTICVSCQSLTVPYTEKGISDKKGKGEKMRILADIALFSIGAVIGVVTVCFAQCAGRADREMEKMMEENNQ